MYIPVGFSIKPYYISSLTATIPLLASCSSWTGRPVTITWDPVKTTVVGSRLVMRATPSADPVYMDVKFNDAPVKRFFWGEGAKGEQSDVVAVSIINGTNLLEAMACKNVGWIGVVDVKVDAYVEVTFEGETPERPWWEVLQEWFVANWPYIAIATGLVIIGGSYYLYVARPKGR